jgi:hypothetical protein
MALVGVAAVSAGTVLLIFDVVVGRSTAYWATACVILLIIAIAVLPPILRRRTDATPVD